MSAPSPAMAHTHRYGPVFLHVETPKRACVVCGVAAPIRLVPVHLIDPMVTALEAIAQTTHHIKLDGQGTHSATCPPCLAEAALDARAAKAKGE